MRTFPFFLFILFSCSLFAQHTLEATLLDGMTRQPVSDAHVYLEGTTIGTSTDSQGKFSLTVRNAMNTPLVISHILYEKIIINEPFRVVLPKVIYLEETSSSFDEVVISARNISRIKRREMLNIFRKQLLGYERSAQSCKILNEDDIVLIHDKENQELRAYAQKPLEIVNNYLKYRILWELIDFKIKYKDTSLSNQSMQHVSIIGTVSFTDIGAYTENLRLRRQVVLNTSIRHFFHLLTINKMQVDIFQNELDNSSFNLYEVEPNGLIKLYNPEKYFTVQKDTSNPSMNLVIINPATKDSLTNSLSVYVLHKEALRNLNWVSETKLTPEMYFQRVREAEKDAKVYGYRLSISQIKRMRAVSDYKEIMYKTNSMPDGNSSKITFYADTFLIDMYGNTNLYQNYIVTNKLARQRLGDLLPSDYEDVPLGNNQTLIDAPEEPENDLFLNIEERIDARYLRQLQLYPQEKIYVHTDKSNYLGGETIWFRAYLADYATHNPAEAQSRYVYGELFNPLDSLLQRVKIRQDSVGVFKGYFDLPANIATGTCRLRFYTRYMEESGEEYFFNRQIQVGHVLSALYHTDVTFNYLENGRKLHATLRFTQIKDGAPFVPQLLRIVHSSGKEDFIPVSAQGVAVFDIPSERDLDQNPLYIEYEFNDMLCRQYLTIPSLQSDYNVSFFPEGGALLSGVPVRVAFKALHSGGLSEQVTGKVYNEKGDTVAVFSSNPLGMGSFSFAPRKNEKYTALCRNSFGAEKRFDFPTVNDHSINLKAEWNNDRLMVQVIKSADLLLPDSMRLIIHCRGILFYNELWTVGKTIAIRKEQFPSGVLQLLLVDKNLNPVSERLTFHLNEQDVAQVAIAADKENYRKREQIRSKISLSSHDSIPLQGSFSVSVTSDRDVLPDTTNHILSSLLLTSELKGYVERPAWYFTEGRLEEIDHLLLTQGWSRYDVAALLKGYIHKPTQLAETLPEISGRVTSGLFLQNRGDGYYVIMSEAGNKEKHDGTIASVQNGRFRVSYNEKPNGISYNLQLVFPPNSIRAEMQIDPVVYPDLRIRLPYLSDATRAGFDAYAKNAGSQYVSGDGELTRHLEEVVISTKRIKGIHPLSPGRMQDRIIPLDELNTRKKSAKTLHQLLMSTADVNIRRDANGDLRVRYNHGLYYYDYAIVVDGKWWPMYSTEELSKTYGEVDNLTGNSITKREMKTYVNNNLETILSIPADRLEEIEIVRAPAPPISLKDFGNVVVNDPFLYGIKEKTGIYEDASTTVFGHTGYLGTILITTKARNGGLTDDKKGRSLKVTPLGYQVKKEFYSPAYETAEQQSATTPDPRTTIYWNPDVRTNEDGVAEMLFYAADPDTNYTVTIEGITEEGVLISKTEKIRRSAGRQCALLSCGNISTQ